jgi:hypothetical protein
LGCYKNQFEENVDELPSVSVKQELLQEGMNYEYDFLNL